MTNPQARYGHNPNAEQDQPLAKHLPTVATSEAAIAADAPFAVALLQRCGAMDLAPMLGVA